MSYPVPGVDEENINPELPDEDNSEVDPELIEEEPVV